MFTPASSVSAIMTLFSDSFRQAQAVLVLRGADPVGAKNDILPPLIYPECIHFSADLFQQFDVAFVVQGA